MVYKIISGGQTGVDRAALDVALELEIACGGWCPQGRLAEDGVLDPKYPLLETPTSTYSQRTEWNVRDADGTLILGWGAPAGGTLKTLALAQRMRKPFWLLDLKEKKDPAEVTQWLEKANIHVLNVAGPRGSESPEIYAAAKQFLLLLFADD